MRIDVLDLGSNTFHLLAANVVGGTVTRVDDASIAVRLGERAFAKGRITEKAWARGIDAIDKLLDRCQTMPITVATGVFREAANATQFVDEVRGRFGLHIAILPGNEEARLSYRGVLADALDPDARIAVFDLGGGSLECSTGVGGRVELADSLPIGVLRFARLTAGEVRARVREIAAPIVTAIRASSPDEVILSSGTARALGRVTRELGIREPVIGCLSAGTVKRLASQLPAMETRDICSLGISASRSDVIGTGAIVLAAIVEMIGVPFVRIATGALREGVALETAATRVPDRVLGSRVTFVQESPSVREERVSCAHARHASS